MNSTAYDLSRFEAKPKQQQQDNSKPKLQAVKTEKKNPQRKLSPIVGLLLFTVTAFICSYMIYTRVLITETTAAITRVNKEIVTLQSEEVRLKSELEAVMARENIEERALALGMYQADKFQVECVEVNKGDRIEILEDERNIFEKVGDYLSNLF